VLLFGLGKLGTDVSHSRKREGGLAQGRGGYSSKVCMGMYHPLPLLCFKVMPHKK